MKVHMAGKLCHQVNVDTAVLMGLCTTGAAAELRDLTGVWAAVRYLVAVGGSQTDVVKKHARWILTVDAEAGLEMFTQMQPPLPPHAVLPILAGHAPSLCATYLEAAIAQGSVSAQVSMYCLSPFPIAAYLPCVCCELSGLAIYLILLHALLPGSV